MKLSTLVAFVGCALFAEIAGASPTCHCHDVFVVHEGREYLFSQDGLDYYRWHYKVTADGCTNRGLSCWTLAVCSDWLPYITEVSIVSADNSDPAHGETTYYDYTLGVDPISGVVGIRWRHTGGNRLDTPGEYDSFSFVSPGVDGRLNTVNWVSRAGFQFDGGDVDGPCCTAIPTAQTSWGLLKSIYR
jgi:hypothetical protein